MPTNPQSDTGCVPTINANRASAMGMPHPFNPTLARRLSLVGKSCLPQRIVGKYFLGGNSCLGKICLGAPPIRNLFGFGLGQVTQDAP